MKQRWIIQPKKYLHYSYLGGFSLLLSFPVWAAEPSNATAVLPTVEVTANNAQDSKTAYSQNKTPSKTVSRLSLTPKETAQSISVVTSQQISDFQLDTMNDVLRHAAGITVEAVETDRTYFTSRGFDVSNFQRDGLGLPPFFTVIDGNLDSVLYEKIEVLTGANAIASVHGDPSATVNFVRKRPKKESETSVKLSGGTWNKKRIELDSSQVLNSTMAVRAVAAIENKKSWLDRYERDTQVAGLTFRAEPSRHTRINLGINLEKSEATNPLWGALPLIYADGSPTHYDRSTSTSTNWGYWNNQVTMSFIELEQDLTPYWTLKATLSQTDKESDSKLFYVYGQYDSKTGTGLKSYPSRYDEELNQKLADISLTGLFDWWGRENEVVLAGQWSKGDIEQMSYYGKGIGTDIGALETWQGNYPEPSFNAAQQGGGWQETQKSLMAAAKIRPLEALLVTVGGRLMNIEADGLSYGTVRDRDIDNEFAPYIGLVYDLNRDLAVYASTSKVFAPQHEINLQRQSLAPKEGQSYELGFKTSVNDDKALASIAFFKAEQDNVAVAAGKIPNSNDTYYNTADGVKSQGIELQLTGEIAPNLQMNSSYTQQQIKQDGEDFKTYIPEKILRVGLSYQLPSLPALKVGTIVKWQDDIYTTVNGFEVKQAAYAVVDVTASYAVTDKITTQLTVNNLTDKSYYSSLYWDQSFYGAPRHVVGSVSMKF